MTSSDRLTINTERADQALAALHAAKTTAEQLAAAQALESAACQLRRTLKKQAAA